MKTKFLVIVVAILQSLGLKSVADKIDPINLLSSNSVTPKKGNSNWNLQEDIEDRNNETV